MSSKRKPHNDFAGYIFERKCRMGHLVCLNAIEAEIDAEHKYVVVFEGKFKKMIGMSFASLAKAREFVKLDAAGLSGYQWQ